MLTTLLAVVAGYSFSQNLPTPPDVAKKPYLVKATHGATRSDEYYWLRDDTRTNKEMLNYLKAENAYADQIMRPLKSLQDSIYKDIIRHVKQDDDLVPYKLRGYSYSTKLKKGQSYPVHMRTKDGSSKEEIVLDVNPLAKGKAYYSVANQTFSQDNNLLAYSEDSVGRRQYTIRVKNLKTGTTYPDAITGTSGEVVWADDNQTLFYVENDPKTLLTTRVKKHVLGTPVASDTLVYEEKDTNFFLNINRTRDDQYVCITVRSITSSETRCAPAKDPQKFTVLAARAPDITYNAEHLNGRWVIRTNAPGADGKPAFNFKLMVASNDATSSAQWQEWVPHREDVLIEQSVLFNEFTAIAERANGLARIRILKADGKEDYVKADEAAYTMQLDGNTDYPTTPWLRYRYGSLTTPFITYELNIKTGERRVVKRTEIPGYDPAQYMTERVWVTARDGVKVPVSLVYKKGFVKNGKAALYLTAYGSYGANFDPSLDTTYHLPRITLLDRGMVYAWAHVRGGQEMGYKWYEDGKLLNKKNTFNDYIDVTDYLVREGYAAKDRVVAEGSSAGGLLMGAIANMAPEKYRVIISSVPFVDVVTTMLDPTIPLTTNEYPEWGNPEQKAYYDYMLSYSPYDNLTKQAYPAIFVYSGLWDSQVQYWEPTKYVARLRDVNIGKFPIVLRTNMAAGHSGSSGRFGFYKDEAERYAFMLNELGIK